MNTKKAMKMLLAGACLLLIYCHSVPVNVDPFGRGTLQVRVRGLRHDRGSVRIALFSEDAASGFPHGKRRLAAFAMVPASLDSDEQQIRFPGLTYGRFALYVFHDENNNEKRDVSRPEEEWAYFLPYWDTEGSGYSQYHRWPFIEPEFEDAAFYVNAPETLVDVDLFYVGPRYGWAMAAGSLFALASGFKK